MDNRKIAAIIIIVAFVFAAVPVAESRYVGGRVYTWQLLDSAVTTAKLAADAITGAKIADEQIDSEHYVNYSIDTEHYENSSIDSNAYANYSIDSEHYANESIDSNVYVNYSIDAEHIAGDAINSTHIENASILSGDIAADAVNDTHIDYANTPVLQYMNATHLNYSKVLVANGSCFTGNSSETEASLSKIDYILVMCTSNHTLITSFDTTGANTFDVYLYHTLNGTIGWANESTTNECVNWTAIGTPA